MPNKFKKFKVKRKFKEDIEPEEILMDSKILKESPDGEREKLEKPISKTVFKFFLVFVVIVLGVLLFKSFQLQIIKGNYWRELAEENRIRSYPIEPLRGVIYDKNKTPLAINVPKLDLVVIPSDLANDENFENIIKRLADSLGKPEQEILTKIQENIHLTYPIVIQEDIEREKALLLESEFVDIPAVIVKKDSWRQYEYGSELAHVLGYLGKANKEELVEGDYFLDDYIGRDGLEKVYEDLLRGVYGEQLVEVDSMGVVQKVLATKESISGEDLVLSIDIGLQRKLYELLEEELRTIASSRAAAVAVNPQNGKILALVSFPSFDSNIFIRGLSSASFENIKSDENNPFLNRVIGGMYPPGSTIKPLIAAAALEEDVINSDKWINCQGYISLVDIYHPDVFWTFRDWKTHGSVNMNKAIAESCNVYFYTIGGGYGDIEGLGIGRIKKYLEMFGWNNVLGIDIFGEEKGFIPSPEWKEETKEEQWYIGDTYNSSIGQGDIMATPLQIAMATAAIANGGTLYRPQLLEDKKEVVLNQNFIDDDIIEVVRKGMQEATVSGSARSLSSLSIKTAGKTGTAQAGTNKSPHSWFTGFAPYDNPEIVITVLVENGGDGSGTAVPVARKLLAWWSERSE